MSIVGIRQNYSQNIRKTNNFSLSGTGNTGKTRPYNGGAVTVNRAQNLSQEQVLLEAFRNFAAQAGITDPAAQDKFAQKWLNEFKSDGGANLLYGGKADSTKFEADRKDGKISLSLAPGSHDAIIRDLRNLQVQQGLITFAEANFTPIAKNAVTGESLTDSLLNSGYDEFQIFNPSQAKRIGLEQKYRDSQYQTIAQDATMGELALDLTQMGLDIVGIFEPTPFADGANTIISAVRGDWGNAALSVIGIVPYVGDLAKFGKIPKWIASIEKISIVVDKLSDVAKLGGKAAEAAKGFVREVRRLLDKIPIEKLPDKLQEAFKSLKGKVEEFFAKMKKVDSPADNIKKSEKITDTSKTVDNIKPKTTDGTTTTTKQPDIEPPQKPKINDSFEEIESIQNLKNISGVSIKKIDETSLKELGALRNTHKIDKFSNIAKAKVSVNKPLTKTDFASYSGFDKFSSKIPNGSVSPNQNTKIFDTFDALTTSGTKLKRQNDAEVKILEELATQLGAKKGDAGIKVFSDVKGKVSISSELTPCGSCSKVIEQFKQMFPGIEIEILAQPKTSF